MIRDKHVQIKSGATLQLTCQITNAQSDVSKDVKWINNGKTLVQGNDITLSSTYGKLTIYSITAGNWLIISFPKSYLAKMMVYNTYTRFFF